MKTTFFQLPKPVVAAALRRRWTTLRGSVSASLKSSAAKSSALTKLERECAALENQIAETERTIDAENPAAVQLLSTRKEQLRLLKARRDEQTRLNAASSRNADQSNRQADFETLSREVGQFFNQYLDGVIEDWSARLEPLFIGRSKNDPLGWAREFVKNSDLLFALSANFVVGVMDRKPLHAKQPAARLVEIADALLSRKNIFAGNQVNHI